MSQDSNRHIAAEIMHRFQQPIIVPPLPDGDLEDNFQVGVPKCQISLNKHAPIDEMGRIDSIVHVESHSKWYGFVGGAYYVLKDRGGNIIFAVAGQPRGVNGRWVTTAPARRDDPETFFIPLEILAGTYSCTIERGRFEGPTYDNIKRTVNEFAKGISGVKEDLKRMGADIKDIGSIIGAS